MKLKALLEGYPCQMADKGLDIDVGRISHDSRFVRPGDLYVCLKGSRTDGHLFAGQAVAGGAVAVVTEKTLALPVPMINVKDSRHALSWLADRFFSQPSRKLHITGITGTNGKTTTTHFLQAIYNAAGLSCASIGTVGLKVGEKYTPCGLTTPETFELHRILAGLVDGQITHVAMEVSSHALAWSRVEHVRFTTAVFTNLSHDHLDFHRSMEDYFQAKAHLFQLLSTQAKQAKAVINGDDHYGRKLLQLVRVPSWSFGMNEGVNVLARLTGNELFVNKMAVTFPGGELDLRVHLPGTFNAYNALAATATALAEGIAQEAIVRGIGAVRSIPGRLETLDFSQEFQIFIDFAHTPEGLEQVLKTLKAMPQRRLITVFGCPGDRDKIKRPLRGRIAEKYSDLVILTSDNPASEDPEAVIRDILAGMTVSPVVLPDREEAVRYALCAAGRGDVVLLAGKGHESYQLVGEEHIPYSDRRAAETFFIS